MEPDGRSPRHSVPLGIVALPQANSALRNLPRSSLSGAYRRGLRNEIRKKLAEQGSLGRPDDDFTTGGIHLFASARVQRKFVVHPNPKYARLWRVGVCPIETGRMEGHGERIDGLHSHASRSLWIRSRLAMSRRNSLPGVDRVYGFKSGWGYFANRQRTPRIWRNRGEKSDSIFCQLWPRISMFCHRYGNPLATLRTKVTNQREHLRPCCRWCSFAYGHYSASTPWRGVLN